MTNEPIHIALASNHRYLPGLLVTMVSMIRASSRKERLHFHIFSDGLLPADKQTLCDIAAEYKIPSPAFHELDLALIKQKFKTYNASHTTFLRLFLPHVLDLDWVIYSDVDTLWMKDPAALWDLRKSTVSVLWCQDLPSTRAFARNYSKWTSCFNEQNYACSGVILMNLARLRRSDLLQKSFDFVARWGTPPFADQDILNHLLGADAEIIPQIWDCLYPTQEAVTGLVYHFNGIGKLFNQPFSGWRPLYYAWFRYYYDFVLKDKERPVCGKTKRFFFWLLGSLPPSRRLLAFLFRGNLARTDNFHRQLFFAWLWRNATWKWR